MVSRGCPYQCTFCEETCSKKLYGPGYFRRKRVDTVIRELVAGKQRYGYREVIFKDSYLSGNKPWLRQLLERYRAEIHVPFKCFCTVSGFDEETARLLKQSGCYSIEFGLQTWNDDLRRDVLNRRETSEEAFLAFGHCDAQRLWYDVDHMFNLPTESEADHVRGAECYRRLRYLSRVKVHHLVYFPTADIVDRAVAAGDLPADAHQRLAEGEESDFYDQASVGSDRRKLVAAYAALYKILPLLPKRTVGWLVRSGACVGCRGFRRRWWPCSRPPTVSAHAIFASPPICGSIRARSTTASAGRSFRKAPCETPREKQLMRKAMGRKRVLAAAIVSLAILLLLAVKTDLRLDRVGAEFQRAHWGILLATFAFSAIWHIVLGADKWWRILRGQGAAVSWGEVFRVRLGSDPIRFALPLKSGELVNAFYFGRDPALGFSRAAGSIAFDKALNFFGTIFWLYVGIAAMARMPTAGQLALHTAVGVGVLVLLWVRPVRRLAATIAAAVHPKLGRLASGVLSAFEEFSGARSSVSWPTASSSRSGRWWSLPCCFTPFSPTASPRCRSSSPTVRSWC